MEGHHEGEPGTRSSPLVIGGSPNAGSVTGPPASRHLVPPSRSSGRSGPATVSDYRQRGGSLGGGSAGLGGIGPAAGAGGILSDQAREAVQRASIVAAASQYVTNGGAGRGGGAQEVYDTMMGGRRGSGADAGAGGSGYHLSDALLSREVARERAAAAAAASAAATVAMQEKKQRADAVAAVVAQQLYRGPTEEEQLAQLRQQQEGAQERSVALLLKQAEGRIARKRSESAAAVAAAAAAATGGSAGLYGMKRSRLLDAGGGAGYSQIGAASRYYPSPSSSVAGASPSLRPQQRQQAPSPHLSGIEAAVGGSKSEDILKHQRLVNQVLSTAAARKAAGNRPSSSTASTSSSPTHKPMEKPSPSVSSHASAPPEGLDIQDLGRGGQGSSKATPASSPPSVQRQRQQYIDRFNPTPGAADDRIRGAKDAASLEVEVVQEGQQQQLRSSPQLKPDRPGGEGGRGMDRRGGSNEGEARTREDIIADVNRMIKQARSGKTTQSASSTSHATTTEMLRAKAADAAAAAAATLNQPAVAAVAAAAAAVSSPPGGGAKRHPGGSPGTGDGTPISWRGRGPVSVELTHSQRAALERTSFFRDDASLIRELSLWEGGMPREGVVKALRRSLLMTCLPQANIPEAEASEIVKCFL